MLVVTLFSLTVSYGTRCVVAYLVGRPIVKRLASGPAEKVFWLLFHQRRRAPVEVEAEVTAAE